MQCPTQNGPHPRPKTNLIWQHCIQWHHDWHSCTTQIQSYGHAILLASWLMSTKTITCSLETRKTQSCQLSIRKSFYTTSYFSLTYLCTQYHPKTNKNSNLNYQKYQRHCKGVFKHIQPQLLSNRRIKNIQCHQCPLHQCWTNIVILHVNILTFPKQMLQEMTSSVLNGDIMVQKGVFWTIGEHLYFVYDPIISSKDKGL